MKALAETRSVFVGQLIGARDAARPHRSQGAGQGGSHVLHRYDQYHAQWCLSVFRHQRRREAVRPTTRPPRHRPTRRPWRTHSWQPLASTQMTPPTQHQRRRHADVPRWPVQPICSTTGLDADWSAASSQNAQEPHLLDRAGRDLDKFQRSGVRKLAEAYTMMSDLGIDEPQRRRLSGPRRYGHAIGRRSGAGRGELNRPNSASPRSASRAPMTGCRSRSTS